MTKNVIQPKIGVFAGIFDEEGKLLVKRRPENISLPGDWDLPGGGVDAEKAIQALDERIIGQELAKEVEEETGIQIPPLSPMPAMYPAVIKGGSDWAFVILIGGLKQRPTKGEWKYVSPEELCQLAEGLEGNRLVSGPGKRMHRLCLRILASRDSPNRRYYGQAFQMLIEIQKRME
jgi:ADP-ribose pyrophosphatase YjhB (NUDIX family)